MSRLLGLLKPFAPEVDFDDIDTSANLQEEVEIDSFDFLNFLIAIDEDMGVMVPESDYGQVMSLDDLMDYITARVV
ncbi:MAG: phosphopantetheine-binding protein [Chloroflexota bacterium]